ncbi:MAG: RNA 2',3'-cyclic phosphodiesterase [Candidatus Binatia bacterium]
MIRAFVAVNLAPVISEEIAKIQFALKAAQGDIRWVRIEGLHLTLKFLGDITREQVAPILTALREALHDRSPFPVWAQGLGAFPNVQRPKVLWAGLLGDDLKEVQAAVETALVPLDFPRDERAFTPHLTLGRVRSLRGWPRVLAEFKRYEQVRFGESEIDRVTLYQSDLRPEGAVYTVLGTVPLLQA